MINKLNSQYVNMIRNYVMDNFDEHNSKFIMQTFVRYCFNRCIFSIFILLQFFYIVIYQLDVIQFIQFLPIYLSCIYSIIISFIIIQRREKISPIEVYYYCSVQIIWILLTFTNMFLPPLLIQHGQMDSFQLTSEVISTFIIIDFIVSSQWIRMILGFIQFILLIIYTFYSVENVYIQIIATIYQLIIDSFNHIESFYVLSEMNNRSKYAYETFHDLRNKVSALKSNISEWESERNNETSNGENQNDILLIHCKSITNFILYQLTKIYSQELLFNNEFKITNDTFEIKDLVTKINKMIGYSIQDRSIKIDVCINTQTLAKFTLDFKLLLQVINIIIDEYQHRGAKQAKIEYSNKNLMIHDHEQLKVSISHYLENQQVEESQIILSCIQNQLKNKNATDNFITIENNTFHYQLQSSQNSDYIELIQDETYNYIIQDNNEVCSKKNFKNISKLSKKNKKKQVKEWDDMIFATNDLDMAFEFRRDSYISEISDSNSMTNNNFINKLKHYSQISNTSNISNNVINNTNSQSKQESSEQCKILYINSNKNQLLSMESQMSMQSMNSNPEEKSGRLSIFSMQELPVQMDILKNELDISNEYPGGNIQINIDDEQSILNMNKRLFNKLNIELILLKTGDELIHYLKELSQNNINSTIIIITDYKLENEKGTDVLKRMRDFMSNKQDSKLDILIQNSLRYIEQGLSSTEDISVHNLFKEMNVKLFPKPLKKSIVEQIINECILIKSGKNTKKNEINNHFMFENEDNIFLSFNKHQNSMGVVNNEEIQGINNVNKKELPLKKKITQCNSNIQYSNNIVTNNINNNNKIMNKSSENNSQKITNNQNSSELNLDSININKSLSTKIKYNKQNTSPSLPYIVENEKLRVLNITHTKVQDEIDIFNNMIENQINPEDISITSEHELYNIQINIDDEKSVLNMNKRLFSKSSIELLTVLTGDELITSIKELSTNSSVNQITVISDQKLETEQGDEVIERVRNFVKNKYDDTLQISIGRELKMRQFALSSTEDVAVHDKFKSMNVKLQQKPLKKQVVSEIIDIKATE